MPVGEVCSTAVPISALRMFSEVNWAGHASSRRKQSCGMSLPHRSKNHLGICLSARQTFGNKHTGAGFGFSHDWASLGLQPLEEVFLQVFVLFETINPGDAGLLIFFWSI